MRELFASEDFDLKTFLTANKEIPIDKLLSELEGVSKSVQNELFELINGDLVHFQKIIEEVCSIDVHSIEQFRAQFHNEKLLNEKNYLIFQEYFEEADKKYQRLKYVQKKKELQVRTNKAQKYIQSFRELKKSAEYSIYELEISVKRYNWLLKFTTDFSTDLIESDIHRELSQYNEILQEIIEINMERLLKSSSSSSFNGQEIHLLLELCGEMHKLNLFEASFKLSIVYVALESFLQGCVCFKGSPLNFKSFIDKIREFLFKLKLTWSGIVNEFYEEESNFWSRTVLAPILGWIAERCSSVFNPIDLDEFKGNFEKGLKFVSDVENEFFVYEDELIFFRSQIQWINFMKKWSLHQYFQIRTRQILTPIENIFNYDFKRSSSISTLTSEEPKIFEPTLIALNSLKLIWSDEVIIKPLIPKFLKVTLQVFRKFIHFCTENHLNQKNPKIFLQISIQKQFNLKQFCLLIEDNLKGQFEKYLDSLEEDLSKQIISILRNESNNSIKKSKNNLIPDIEKLFDQIMKKEELKDLNLETLKILKNQGYTVSKQLIQQILLKFNRIIFKLIDEKRLNSTEYPEILMKMKEIEGEANELGYSDLIKEEFWLEIKAAIN